MTKASQHGTLEVERRGTHKHDPRDTEKASRRDTQTGAFSFWIVGAGIVGASKVKA